MRRTDAGRLIEFFSKDIPFANAFECLLESASDAIYILDTRGNFVTINREAEELTGFKREDWIGKSFRKIIAAKSLPKAVKGFLSVVRGKPIRLELELKTASKKTVLVEVTSKPLIMNGKIVGTLGIARDITERKNAEERIRESEERYRSLVELAPDSIMTFDLKGVITSCNTASTRLSGYSKDELVGKHFSRAGVLRARDIPKYLKMLPFTVRGKVPKPFEVIWQHKNGTLHLGEVRVSLTREKGKMAGIQAIMRDITERKKREEALRHSEERFRNIFESASDAMISLDRAGRILNVNRKAVQVFGGSEEELLGKHFTKVGVVSPRDMPKLLSAFARILAGKPATLGIRIVNMKGQKKFLECSSSLMRIDDKLAGIMVIARDVTERKQATEALKQAEEKHRTMLDTANVLIQSVNAEGKFVYVNKEWKKVLGYADKGLKKITLMDVIRKDYRKHCMDIFNQVVMGKSVRDVEAVFVAKDGREIAVSGNARPILKDGEFVSTVGFFADVTKRKQMENELQEYSEHLEELVEKRTRQLKEAHEQLLKAERLAAIGEMAAMIGHDLRNPLTGIAGAIYYLKTKLGSKMDKKVTEMLDLVGKNIEYSNKIISDLLEYSRKIRLELTETTLKSIIKDALTLIKIPKNIRISDLTQNKPKIKVDVPKIERAFINIIKNAIDAMSKGGTLTITSKESNGNLKIDFIDTGAGMPKEAMEKIWIPLFTTKAKGMGLGLPICKRIVEAHGGDISVESTVSKGTTFTVTIPVEPKLEGGEKIWVNVPESLLSTTTKA